MSITVAFSPDKYYEDAQKMLEKKDLLGFVSKISIAIEASMNDPEMKAKATYLESKGLMEFRQHTKALESIDEALKCNEGLKAFELKELKARAKGYLNCIGEAIEIYKKLLEETKDNIVVSRLCVSLAWAYLILDRKNPEKSSLEEAKKYLDIANQNFEDLPNSLKRKVLNNYSVYYFYLDDFKNSIKSLERAFDFAEEKDLPRLYNNLAEVYLEFREKCGVETTSIKEYLDKSEVIASKYDDKIEMAFSFFTKAKLELLDAQIFTALDTLYLAFDHFTEAEAYSYSLECMLKINEVISNQKAECMRMMQEKLKSKVKSNPYLEKYKK